MDFDESPRTRLQRTNPLERVNTENQAAHQRSRHLPRPRSRHQAGGAPMLEQNDEWAVSRRYVPVEKLTAMCDHLGVAMMIAA